MPLPALAAPLLWGASLKVAATAALEYGPAISSVSLGAILARQVWKRVPSWIRQEGSLTVEDNSSHEILSLTVIIEKLQDMVAVGSEKLSDDQSFLEVSQLQASLLCYIRLAAQLKDRYPNIRDEKYEHISSQPDGNTGSIHWPDIVQGLDFAVWAYDVDTDQLRTKLEAVEFFLVQHTLTANMPPGHVAHYIAACPEQKTLLIGVQGTSTLEDLLIDCVGKATTCEMDTIPFEKELYTLSNDDIMVFDQDNESIATATTPSSAIEISHFDGVRIRCHEGILLSAKRLADKVQSVVHQMTFGNSAYKLLLCGHSLGAGVACLLAILLKSRMPWLENVHVYAYACPPILDYDAALACSSFCTSIVNNSDLIARCSLANLRSFLHVLSAIHTKLTEHGLSPTGPKSTMALFRYLRQGNQGDLLLSCDEIQKEMEDALEKVGLQDSEHLYVPGRVILMYEPWQGEEKGEMDEVESLPRVYGCVTNGVAIPLRFFEFDGSRMVTDHLTASYYISVNALAAADAAKGESEI